MGKFLLLLSIFYLACGPAAPAQSSAKPFKYGVTGHPLTQEAYAGNIDLQIRLLKSLNLKMYRVDLPVDSSGHVMKAKEFATLLTKLRAGGITLLPVLVFNKSLYNAPSPEAAYRSGLNYGKTFARTYKRYFTYYEVGNEEAGGIIRGPQVDGHDLVDYDGPKSKLLMAYFKGVCNGLKAEDPSARLIINEAWVHYGFFQLLRTNGVSYDIIGYHGYSEMGDLMNARRGFRNVIDTLYRQFNKRIWITEMNVRNGTSMRRSPSPEQWFTRNLTTLRRNRHVEAIFVYELLDQPAFDNPASPHNNPTEAYYGLNAWQQKYRQTTPKPLFDVYKSFIRQHP